MNENEELKPNFDTVLSRLGIGCYHYYLYVMICLFYILDGSELTLLPLLSPILTKVWNLSSW